MNTKQTAIVGLLLSAITASVVLHHDAVAPARAEPAGKPSSVPVTRIDGSKKPKKAPPPEASAPAAAMKPCVAGRYAALAAVRTKLVASHGGENTAFEEAFAAEKRALVSSEALRAAGCTP
ncbi:MAG: hypothetical protein HYV09_31205 [Deltaproteobacteria bacterium]|nr:hypothetical protein [Deltaproteobacteria bacterium]